MASCLLKSECIDLKNKLYKMTWWATALNQITVPSGMNMSGGSVAVITTSNGVECYHYNSSTSSWKKDSSVDADISSLASDVSTLQSNSEPIKWLPLTRDGITHGTTSNVLTVGNLPDKDGYTRIVVGMGSTKAGIVVTGYDISESDVVTLRTYNVTGASVSGVALYCTGVYLKDNQMEPVEPVSDG